MPADRLPQTDAGHYRLVCCECGDRREDDGTALACPAPHGPSLLRTEYTRDGFTPDDRATGVYRYHRWLPVRRSLPDTGRTVVRRAERLGAMLGLRELWIAFNGYHPEWEADLTTGSFKELEAATVLGRLPESAGTLVVASAGNTAAAFAELCSRHDVPVVVVVPQSALGQLCSRTPYGPSVRLVAVADAEYADAIALADALAALPGFTAEGGTRNVGRRDGLGTVMLAAYEELGRLPDVYVQAIGSGAGAIAAHEAALRLRCTSGGQAGPLPRLVLAQNSCFAPVHTAWHTGVRPWEGADREPDAVHRAFAPELTNRRPPYDIAGGLADALRDSRGDVLTEDAAAARGAMDAFAELEGADIEPPAGIALAALRSALKDGRVAPGAAVLLNITGGGRARYRREHRLEANAPTLVVPREAAHDARSVAEIAAVVNRSERMARQVAGSVGP
ncbi:cysteate synthase [Kitasatospora aureofaciens]|uniref:cysteate synthase n=1 Tax=Kitasatospora aureofaciens TaxID=1894 RepID=UPI0033EA07B1